jgi:hypothetical protein
VSQRKVIQIACMPMPSPLQDPALYALCDDGSMWALSEDSGGWVRLKSVPQDGAE